MTILKCDLCRKSIKKEPITYGRKNSMSLQAITNPRVVFEGGKPQEVILRWKDYTELLERLEDEYE